MKKVFCLFTFLIFLLGFNNANSQSFSVFNCDASKFPTVTANFFAFDSLGNQITNLSPSDFAVTENGQPRVITNVSCPNIKEAIALSSVLVIDISSSMNGAPLDMAKAAAFAWINMLPLGKSECAVTSFSDESYINQDFTTNKGRLINCITELAVIGGTNYDAALVGSNVGGIDIAKKGKYKRVIVYISDGGPNFDPNTPYIVSEANANNIAIYCVTIAQPAPQCMKDFSNQTGGICFENIKTVKEAEDCYRQILTMAQGGDPCEIEWESGVHCVGGNQKVELLLSSLNINSNTNYLLPNNAIARLEFSPRSIKFLKGDIGIKQNTNVTVTAINSDFNVTSVTSSNPAFSLTPTNFYLAKNQSIDLAVSYTPVDSSYNYTRFTIEGDPCTMVFGAAGGFIGKKPKIQTLKLIHPNGGEVFAVSSDTVISWEGVLSTDSVKIQYSIDKGTHWKTLTDTASNLKYFWKNIAPPTSKECLVKVVQLADTAKTYKPGTLINTLESKIIVNNWYGSQPTEAQWSPDSKFCAVVNPNSLICICDAATGKIINTLIGYTNLSASIAWSPMGDLIATASYDGSVKIWDPSNGTALLTLSIPSSTLYGVSWSPDGKFVVTPCSDKTAIIWDAYNGTLINTLVGHKGSVNIANWSPDNQYIGTSSSDGTSKIWDVISGTDVYTFGDTTLLGKVGNISWSRDGSIITTSTDIGALATWDADTKKLLNLFYGKGACSPDGSRIAIIRNNNSTIIYDIRTANELATLEGYSTLCWNPDGTKLATNDQDKSAYIWDALTGQKLNTLSGHKDYISKINWSPDGTRIASTSIDTTAKIWYADDLHIEVQSDESDAVFSIVAPQATSKDVIMGKCALNSSKDSLVKEFIMNLDSYKFRVDSIYFAGSDADAFKLVSGYPKYEINPNESRNAEFKFIPKRVGIHNATINIITQSDTLVQNITGEGVEQKLLVISNLLDFGQVQLGTEKVIQDTALIKNVSGSPVTIKNVTLLGPDKKQFEIISGGGAFTLQPNEIRKLTVRFKPVYFGRTSGQLGFEYDGVGSPEIVQLFGNGIGEFLLSIENDSAYAGEKRNLGLAISKIKIENLAKLAKNFEAKIRFQRTILTPLKTTDRNIVNDSIYVTIQGTIGSSYELAQIPVMAGLGSVTETSIDIVDFVLMDSTGNRVDYDIETTPGLFKLLGICREGGTRLFNPTGKAEILQIIPNPANDKIEININLIEDGETTLSVFNSNGIKLKMINITGETGFRTVNLNAKDFDNGLYFIKLQTPTVIENQKLMIIK